jgi:hypothetical protein
LSWNSLGTSLFEHLGLRVACGALRPKPKDVLGDENRNHSSDHERQRGHERTPRKTAQSANSMAARTTISKTRPKSDKQSGNDRGSNGNGVNRGEVRGTNQENGESGEQQPSNEKKSFRTIFDFRPERSANDAADSGDSSIKDQKYRCGSSNEDAANEGREK